MAPAIVRADSLMRVMPRETLVEVSGTAIAGGYPRGIVADAAIYQALYNRIMAAQLEALISYGMAVTKYEEFNQGDRVLIRVTAVPERVWRP